MRVPPPPTRLVHVCLSSSFTKKSETPRITNSISSTVWENKFWKTSFDFVRNYTTVHATSPARIQTKEDACNTQVRAQVVLLVGGGRACTLQVTARHEASQKNPLSQKTARCACGDLLLSTCRTYCGATPNLHARHVVCLLLLIHHPCYFVRVIAVFMSQTSYHFLPFSKTTQLLLTVPMPQQGEWDIIFLMSCSIMMLLMGMMIGRKN